ncbi:hypothetical protein [Nonomuraea gerenzanensis]|uniref:Uncharacterized protein n=1 Tax=Nonomuraea gerenzanensis TaxID=93944 RepID=A0A1M4EK28_9ACTN|nr:hypothetical protein [Nonomuraea gerenzanensis]SBO99222.1 hypothetical protein BN4615_P8738 [Nonomuraea gerenzanensis]
MSGEQRKFELSMPQVLGSALAAVTAAVAASYLGVAGTVIGAAVVSVASTIATAVYTHYLKQTGERVKQRAPLSNRRGEPVAEERDTTLVMPAIRRAAFRLPWLKVGAAAAVVFGVSMGSILVYQAAAQQTVHEQVTGKTPAKAQQQRQQEEDERQEEERAPATPQTPYVVPPVSTDPQVTPERTREEEPAPSRTPTARPTPTPKPTPTPTPSPSGTVEPSQEGTTSAPPQEGEPGEGPSQDRPEPEYGTPPG